MMIKRCSPASAALVGCLILAMAGMHSRAFSREIEVKQSHAEEAERRAAAEMAVSAAAIDGAVGRCRMLKKIEACASLVGAKNDSLVDDDKRLVPTGPNPLHNR